MTWILDITLKQSAKLAMHGKSRHLWPNNDLPKPKKPRQHQAYILTDCQLIILEELFGNGQFTKAVLLDSQGR